MRIWDIPPSKLCRQHLLGEHRELHALWTILTENKQGYRHHPETKRWEGKLLALYHRHLLLVAELEKRGYHHSSPLDKSLASGSGFQDKYLETPAEQIGLLRQKACGCKV